MEQLQDGVLIVWSYVGATVVLLGMLSGVFGAGMHYGQLQTESAYQLRAIEERDRANADLLKQLADKDAERVREAADLVQMQTDLEAIRRSAGSVGSQLRSALDASNLATCVLDPDVQRLRAESYKAAGAAVDAANQARGTH